MTGTHRIDESGFPETPILITNTENVGIVRDAAWQWMDRNSYCAPFMKEYWYAYPVVAETYDGMLNDIRGLGRSCSLSPFHCGRRGRLPCHPLWSCRLLQPLTLAKYVIQLSHDCLFF
jgi:hypothetical protein